MTATPRAGGGDGEDLEAQPVADDFECVGAGASCPLHEVGDREWALPRLLGKAQEFAACPVLVLEQVAGGQECYGALLSRESPLPHLLDDGQQPFVVLLEFFESSPDDGAFGFAPSVGFGKLALLDFFGRENTLSTQLLDSLGNLFEGLGNVCDCPARSLQACSESPAVGLVPLEGVEPVQQHRVVVGCQTGFLKRSME